MYELNSALCESTISVSGWLNIVQCLPYLHIL